MKFRSEDTMKDDGFAAGFVTFILLVCLVIITAELISIAKSLRTLAAPPIEMQFKLDEGVGEPLAGGWVEACGDLPGMVGDDC